MAGKLTITFLDYSGEKSTVQVGSVTLTAANFTNTMAALDTLEAAIAGLSLATEMKQTRLAVEELLSSALPTDVNAQRELKWLVTYRDSISNELFQLEIPAPKLTGNLQANSDRALLTSTDWAAFVSAFEGTAVSPRGNQCEVISAQLVGRNV